MSDLRKKIPAFHKKIWIVSGLCSAIGGGIGGYISALRGNHIYTIIGAAIGYFTGIIIGILTAKQTRLKSLENTETIVQYVAGVACFLLVVAGIIGFILTRKWIGILGALFFGACGIYLLRKKS